ncbi:MAG TPA: alpha/beta hydrolase, partial [Candidatus Berkiella sp.]|nr:alpha/beta hydrolase [Candidatus Berkiella sp.]
DPTLERLVNMVYRSGFGKLHQYTPEQIMEILRLPHLRITPVAASDFHIRDDLSVRCYTPANIEDASSLPAVIFLSATGYIINHMASCNEYCSLLANKLGMKILYISHRLAPLCQFPEFLYECLDAIKWIYQEAKTLGIDSNKIAIWGESSGGNIAASLTHLLRDQSLDIVRHQTLIYPMVDLSHDYPSKKDFAHGYLLDITFIDYLEGMVFSAGKYRQDGLASPLLNPNFNQLPAATIITAECDPLRDEGEAYGQKLQAHQTAVSAKRFPGMIHGFLRFYNKLPLANEAFDFACDQLKAAFISTTPRIHL